MCISNMNMHPLIYEISYIYFLLLFLASTIPRAATPINAAFVTNCVSTPVFTLPVFVLFVVVASFFFSSSFYESLHLLPVNFFDSPIRIRQTRLHESLHFHNQPEPYPELVLHLHTHLKD